MKTTPALSGASALASGGAPELSCGAAAMISFSRSQRIAAAQQNSERLASGGLGLFRE
jgi:hypothetical protein